MAFKFFLVALFATAANAGFLAGSPAYAPLAYAAAPATKSIDADYDPNPQYSYAYDVQDSLTGDSKSQQESRNGDIVQGSYSLLESDGTRRIVDYTADPTNGFNAVVRKEPAQVAVKTVAAAPIAAYAAPAITKIATPIAHAKIATPVAYAAPAAYVARSYAPTAYAAPATYAAPAYAKIAAPAQAYIGSAGPLSYISHVSYSTPLFSYSH